MGLQIWLPLNGSLENKGLHSIKPQYVSSLSANTTNLGKVTAKSYEWTVDGQAINLPGFMNVFKNYKKYTIAAWIYYTGPAGNHSSAICSSGNWNNYNLTFGLNDYSSGYKKILVPSARSGGWSDGITISTLALNTWHHLAVTYDGAVSHVYINGQEVGSFNGGGITANSETSNLYIGAATYYAQFTLKGRINDFRIYDHCCSAKEIAEVAKGLAVHYPLDNNGQGGTNLLTNGNVLTTNNSYGGFTVNPNPIMVAGETYTLTLCVTPAANVTSYAAYVSGGYRSLATFTVNGTEQQIITKTFTCNYYAGREPSVNASYANITFYRFPNEGQVTTNSTFHWAKLEKGTGETLGIWTPHHTADPLHNIIYDGSGYDNHGTASVGLYTEKGSPRYDDATVFDGSSTWITVPIKDLMANLLKNQCTINFWCREGNTGSRSVYLGGYNTGNFNIEMTGGKFRVYWNANPDRTVSSVENNTWTMWTVVVNKASGFKIYKNGVLVDDYAKTSSSMPDISITGNFRIGWDFRNNNNSDGTVFEGAMSDFKIYATALSANDVAELYQVSISIDDNGRAFASSFKEE